MKYQKWPVIRDYVFGWTVGLIIYTLVHNVGANTEDQSGFTVELGLLLSVVFGVIFGVSLGFLQLWFERLYHKRTSALKLVTLSTGFTFGVILSMLLIIYLVMIFTLDLKDTSFSQFLLEGSVLVFMGYIFLLVVSMSVLRQINLMLGPGVLMKLLKGEFYKPTEEERVFMFLDLKDSTTLAEELGHFKYSQMIQDCFDDLAVVKENGGEVYQYVGDEAVLTWSKGEGLKNHNCLLAYFKFTERITSRREYYMAKYNRLPYFKAGLNIGKVMVAEVGKIKKEIAYHGDTINTAARIQGKCNEFGRALLVSETLKNGLRELNNMSFEQMGNIPLKGKAESVTIYAVIENA